MRVHARACASACEVYLRSVEMERTSQGKERRGGGTEASKQYARVCDLWAVWIVDSLLRVPPSTPHVYYVRAYICVPCTYEVNPTSCIPHR